MYKFRIVNPRPIFTVSCYVCDRRIQSDLRVIYADLEGEAFKAYYCEGCYREAIENTRKSHETLL